MAVSDQQFNAQQERVRKIAESYEGPEKKEVAELYVDRIAKLKSAIMESNMGDSQKEDYLKRLDSYLHLVDPNNLQRLKKEYEPLLKSMEATLPPEVQEKALDDREAKLEDVVDLKIRQELLEEWREATKFRNKFDSKKQQIELLMKTKNLDPAGTELQFYMTSMETYTDFLDSKMKEYYATKDIGEKHTKLREIREEGDNFYEVLTECEKLLQGVKSQDDLVVIDLENRSTLAWQSMFIKRKRYDESKAKLYKQIEDMHIPKDDPMRKNIEGMLAAADDQFDMYKENVLGAKTLEERTAQAELANKNLDSANEIVSGAYKWLQYVDISKTMTLRVPTMAKIIESSKCPTMVEKFLKGASFGILLSPQLAVGFGYYQSYKTGKEGGSSGSDTALEVADFAISLVPFAGGAYDMGMAIYGKTLSGRQMGTGERVVRGVIGLGSIVLDVFTFGLGGSLLKAGGKTAVKAGVEITAHAAAKAALEGAGKVGVKATEEAVLKGGVEVVAKGTEEAVVKGGAEAVARGIEKGAVEEGAKLAEKGVLDAGMQTSINNSIKNLTNAEKTALIKVAEGTATAAEKSVARKIIKEIVSESIKPFAEQLGKKQAAKLAEQSAKIATRPAGRINRFLGAATFGGYKYGGEKGLETAISKGVVAEKAIQETFAAGKHVAGEYYVKSQFVKDGEILWGGMAKSIGKDAGKMWLHMHDPREVLKLLQTPGRFLNGLFRRAVKGAPKNLFMSKAALEDLELQAKEALKTDGHDAKAVDALFEDVKKKPWEAVMKENENNPIFKDPEVVEFLKSFQDQFPKSGLLEVKLSGNFPFVIGKGEQGKALSGLYSGFRDLGNDTITSAKMAYNARKMEWEDFVKTYGANLGSDKAAIDALKSQYESLHTMDRAMPVRIKQVKAERAAVKEAANLSKESLARLQGELGVLNEEKSQIETILGQYSEKVAAGDGKTIAKQQQWKNLYESYEKLPEGQLKKAIDEFRDDRIKALGREVKADSEEFKNLTGLAMREVLPARILDIEERIAAKQLEVDAAGALNVENAINAKVKDSGQTIPKLEPKVSQVGLADQRAARAKEMAAIEMVRNKKVAMKNLKSDVEVLKSEKADIDKVVKNYEELLKKRQGELGTELLSKEQEAEVWFEVYNKMPKNYLKSEIDAIRRKSISFPQAGTAEFGRKMGEITKNHMVENSIRLEGAIKTKTEQFEALKSELENPSKTAAVANQPPPNPTSGSGPLPNPGAPGVPANDNTTAAAA